MKQVDHHYQRVDLGEIGYLEATRDDTDEIQDFHLAAYLKNGTKTREIHVIYNIQYDYYRYQEWKYGVLIIDSMSSLYTYGHLQEEYSMMEPPEWWENPYPDNFEPVKPEGSDMFRSEGSGLTVFLFEHKTTAEVNFYIFKDLQEWRRPQKNLLTRVDVSDPQDQSWMWSEEAEQRETPVDPINARSKRIEAYKRHEDYLGVPIPLDPRFID